MMVHVVSIVGCTNPLSFNYNVNVLMILLYTYHFRLYKPTASNFDPNANVSIAFGGPSDNSFGTGGQFNGDQYLIFDSFKECIIRSALIYSEAQIPLHLSLETITQMF